MTGSSRNVRHSPAASHRAKQRIKERRSNIYQERGPVRLWRSTHWSNSQHWQHRVRLRCVSTRLLWWELMATERAQYVCQTLSRKDSSERLGLHSLTAEMLDRLDWSFFKIARARQSFKLPFSGHGGIALSEPALGLDKTLHEIDERLYDLFDYPDPSILQRV